MLFFDGWELNMEAIVAMQRYIAETEGKNMLLDRLDNPFAVREPHIYHKASFML